MAQVIFVMGNKGGVESMQHNRARHSGEKSDNERERSEVSCGWVANKFDDALLRGLGKSARNSNATLPMG